MKTFMAMLNFWIAGIYYLLYGEQREHNDMLALFWAIMEVTSAANLCQQ